MLHSFEKGYISNSNLSTTNSGWEGGFTMLSLSFFFLIVIFTHTNLGKVLCEQCFNSYRVLEKKLFALLLLVTLNPLCVEAQGVFSEFHRWAP